MFEELNRKLQLANQALDRYYRTGDPFDQVIYQFAMAPINQMLLDAGKRPDSAPPSQAP
jgi:hypothetical protein